MSRCRVLAAAAAIVVALSRPASAQVPANPHGASVGACAECHRPDAWRPAHIAPTFRHAEKVFPLDGAHSGTPCTTCHTSLDFSKAPTRCASCHDDVHRGELGVDCARCHSTRSFIDQARLGRMHEETRFPLRGAHAAAPCESCHIPGAAGQVQYRGLPTTCIGCHRADFDHAANPPHASAGFPSNCESCHTETTWLSATFDHNATAFPLTGAHQAVSCNSCHADGVFKGKPTSCAACHQADFDQTTDPPHAASGFATTCATCHSTASWTGATFDHNATQFPLTGAHLAVTCAGCHADGVFKGKPTACVACHQPDFDKTTDPPHGAAGLATTCATCHTTVAWTGAAFDHNTTPFPLTGAHQTVPCNSCHGDGIYHGKPTACVGCHQGDFDKTTDPDHKAAGYGTDCTTCHTTAAWQGANFDHNTTAFPLTGAHQAVPCIGCHADGVFKGKPTTCVSCHQPDYAATTDPSHGAAGFATTCADCHTTTAWTGASFDHGTTTFPLTGAHLALPCSSCHGDGVFKGKPTACVACHQPDFDKAADPPHAASGFPTTCADCHTTVTWTGATFNHNTTAFPLTGAHLAVACTGCHGDGVFKGKPTTCVSCHQPDFNQTTDPPHGAAGFATTCADCHTTAAWTGATFDHNATAFPLTGAHVTVACAACHGDGVFKGKPTTCVSCHQTDYNTTTDPNHQAASFPTTCESCHTTATWSGATFDHDGQYFPIYSGKHKGVWSSCSTCHTSSSDYAAFSCTTGCHGKSGTDSNHKGVSGYQYVSTACYSCHPKGKGD